MLTYTIRGLHLCNYIHTALSLCVCTESSDQPGLGYALSNMTERINLSGCTLLAGSRATVGRNKSPLRKVDTAAHMSAADKYPEPSAS